MLREWTPGGCVELGDGDGELAAQTTQTQAVLQARR
jgi:hypothetical protein